ncbi:methyltransferase domain-containing protein [Nitrospinaceae bacterium]|nr:methyltransferase domain-containing protein [Nitrospinaceae bacterium]
MILKKVRIDLGAGRLDSNKVVRYKRYIDESYDPSDYFAIDKHSLPGIKIVCDFTEGIPLKDNSVDELICIHVLEHIFDLKSMMKELHRVLKNEGVLKIWVLHCFSPTAFGDSTHVRFFTFETFKQFDKQNQGSYYYDFYFGFVRSKMQIFRRWYQTNFFDRFLEILINLNQRRGERFLKILPYKEWEVYSELRKLQ